jgi:hypothetical protein
VDKYVCGGCFGDECIQEFVSEEAVSNKCSYCDKQAPVPIAAEISSVAEFIEDGLRSEFGDAVENLPWESAEGGWQGRTWDTYELLTDKAELGIESDDLLSDLISLLPEIDWCDYDPFGLPKNRELAIDWRRFSELVKHNMRYVFFRVESHHDETELPWERGESYEILYRIGELVNELQLFKTIPPWNIFFRARVHDSQKYADVGNLGPHLRIGAKNANRFSPAGIAMFYGALDIDTAIAEVEDCARKPQRIASVGRFENIHALHVIDLSNLPPYPSIFNGQTQDGRAPLRFLKSFVQDCTQSVVKDGGEHIDYVPTQVVTEFFRYLFKDSDGNSCDGLLYPSVRNQSGVCCVIFCSAEDCTQDRQPLKEPWGSPKAALLSLDSRGIVHRTLP